MEYIVISKQTAQDLGFSIDTHRYVGEQMVVNEKELLMNPLVKGDDTQERAKSINGKVMSLAEVEQFINNGGK